MNSFRILCSFCVTDECKDTVEYGNDHPQITIRSPLSPDSLNCIELLVSVRQLVQE